MRRNFSHKRRRTENKWSPSFVLYSFPLQDGNLGQKAPQFVTFGAANKYRDSQIGSPPIHATSDKPFCVQSGHNRLCIEAQQTTTVLAKNVVKVCVTKTSTHATFDHVFLANRVYISYPALAAWPVRCPSSPRC